MNESLSRSRLDENLSEDAKKLRDDLEMRNRSLSKKKEEMQRENLEGEKNKRFVPLRNNTSFSRDYTMKELE